MDRLIELRDKYMESENVSEAVYHALAEGIAQRILLPGARIVEVEIAEMLQVSRTPVREAIKRLINDELLIYSANGNICVKKFSPTEVRNLIFALDDLRITSSMHAADVITRFQLMELKEVLEQIDEIIQDPNGLYVGKEAEKAVKVNEYDDMFHAIICEATENPYIISHYHKLTRIFSIVKNSEEFKKLTSRSFSQSSQDERYQIYQALVDRDSRKALEYSAKHAEWIYRWKISSINND